MHGNSCWEGPICRINDRYPTRELLFVTYPKSVCDRCSPGESGHLFRSASGTEARTAATASTVLTEDEELERTLQRVTARCCELRNMGIDLQKVLNRLAILEAQVKGLQNEQGKRPLSLLRHKTSLASKTWSGS